LGEDSGEDISVILFSLLGDKQCGKVDEGKFVEKLCRDRSIMNNILQYFHQPRFLNIPTNQLNINQRVVLFLVVEFRMHLQKCLNQSTYILPLNPIQSNPISQNFPEPQTKIIPRGRKRLITRQSPVKIISTRQKVL
jgi:hypothetical protein